MNSINTHGWKWKPERKISKSEKDPIVCLLLAEMNGPFLHCLLSLSLSTYKMIENKRVSWLGIPVSLILLNCIPFIFLPLLCNIFKTYSLDSSLSLYIGTAISAHCECNYKCTNWSTRNTRTLISTKYRSQLVDVKNEYWISYIITASAAPKSCRTHQ